MSKKKKKSFKPGDLSKKEIDELLNRQRIRILAKYVDKHYTENPDFIDKVEWFMNGNIKREIIEGLDSEYSILRDDPDDENIGKMIEEKVKSPEEAYSLFISDMHFGSDHFLEKGFTKFIDCSPNNPGSLLPFWVSLSFANK